jgi:transcriptional regulator with XRE-family HTH domain
MIDPDQIRAARALLHLEQQDVAKKARVSVATIRRVEASEGIARVSPRIVDSIRRALEDSGAEFIENGVRRRGFRTPEEKETLRRDIAAIADRVRRLSSENPSFSENDLYDELGLPA